jgi:hypothetical protein
MVEGVTVLRCTACGARTQAMGPDGETSAPSRGSPSRTGIWKRPELVELLERDCSDELPIVALELEEAEDVCVDILESLEELRSLATGPNFVIEPGALTAIIDSLRAWRSGFEHLRKRFENPGTNT